MSITRSGAQRVTVPAYTQNISSAGVLFTTEREPDVGGPIEYVITLNNHGMQSVSLRCVGKVVRTEKLPNGAEPAAYRIAATLERYEFVRD
jgi:hypothetical protein